jgi:restriction system protein
MAISLQKLISSTMDDIANRNYWLVRTFSGNYYEQFRDHNFIGIGWNEITLNDISKIDFETHTKELKQNRKTNLNILASKVQFPEEKDFASDESKANAGVRAIHQIWTFIKEMKKGDIVLIPSENSDYYSFGEIEETSVMLASSMDIYATNCDLIKRKKIKWIKFDYPREKLDSNYLKFLRVQSTITKISDYKYYVEKTISNIFVEDGKSYFVFNVSKSKEVYVSHYNAILTVLDYAYNAIVTYSEESPNEPEMRTNVQSPGDIIIISELLSNPYWIAIIIVALCGGGLAIDSWKLKFGSTGILRTISSIFDDNQNRKNKDTIRKKIEELDPKAFLKSENIVKMLLEAENKQKSIPGGNDIE